MRSNLYLKIRIIFNNLYDLVFKKIIVTVSIS